MSMGFDILCIDKKGKRKLYSNADSKLLKILGNRKRTLIVSPAISNVGFDIGTAFTLKKKGGAI